MSSRILIIEDEPKIARFIELELKYEGYEVEISSDGRNGLQRAKEGEFDLILLDLMLPQMSGIEVLRRIRQSKDEIPIIMVTAKDDISDKVMGLDMGADDYLTKPFEIEELLARIRVALKRNINTENGMGKEKSYTYEELELDDQRKQVTYKNQNIELTKKEYELLKYLLENKNIALDREKILEKVWGYDYFGDTNVIDVYIRYLRSKIDQAYGIDMIKTVRGVGYAIYEG